MTSSFSAAVTPWSVDDPGFRVRLRLGDNGLGGACGSRVVGPQAVENLPQSLELHGDCLSRLSQHHSTRFMDSRGRGVELLFLGLKFCSLAEHHGFNPRHRVADIAEQCRPFAGIDVVMACESVGDLAADLGEAVVGDHQLIADPPRALELCHRVFAQ